MKELVQNIAKALVDKGNSRLARAGAMKLHTVYPRDHRGAKLREKRKVTRQYYRPRRSFTRSAQS
jgi:hypothetical protein